jgi:hypothetical protein
LTIDLARGTDDLWNRCRGREVEAGDQHGTLDDLLRDAREAGFRDVEVETLRDWGDVPTDIGWLVFERLATRSEH